MIAFVDYGDFCTSGAKSNQKMQDIVNYYVAMHEANGGKVQKEKVMMHSLKWKK